MGAPGCKASRELPYVGPRGLACARRAVGTAHSAPKSRHGRAREHLSTESSWVWMNEMKVCSKKLRFSGYDLRKADISGSSFGGGEGPVQLLR